MRILAIFLLWLSIQTGWSQKVIKPKIGFIPDISTLAVERAKIGKAQYEKLKARMDKGLKYEQLTKQELELYEKYAYEDPDPWVVGPPGFCSWYCGVTELTIKASSTLAPQGTNTYYADNAHDGTLNSAWVEGAKGYGIGEYIEYAFGKNNPPVTKVILFNGYVKSDKSWKDNARIKKLKLYVNGKPYAILELQDTKAEQTFDVGSLENRPGKLVLRFEILDVYKGLKWEDTVLSELYFDGTGVHCFAAGSMVTLADGSTKDIKNISEGDQILSFNEANKKFEAAEVLETASVMHHNLVQYTFDNTSFIGTDDHPFFTLHGWASVQPKASEAYLAQVEKLRVGEKIYKFEKGDLMNTKLVGLKPLAICMPTYTIVRLSRNNTFMVNGILVGVETLRPNRVDDF